MIMEFSLSEIYEVADKIRENEQALNERFSGSGFAGGATAILEWMLGETTKDELLSDLELE